MTRTLRAATLLLALALAAGCLPSGSGPTPGPSGPVASPTATPAGPSPTPSFSRPTPTPGPTFRTHVVVAGETLHSIARLHDTTARSIAWWNRAAYPSLDPESAAYRPDRIEIGWTLLVIPGVEVDDGNPPSLSPGSPRPTPTPTPAVTHPPLTPAPGAGAIVVSHGARGTKQVALTFDMGGRLDPALEIVAWLRDHDVRATIFPTGKTATETAIGRAVMDQVGRQPGQFDIGNHTWDHPYLTELDAATIGDQIQRTEDGIAGATGQTTRPWLRPPYGAWDEAVRRAVGDAGWAYLVMWDIDTIDWRPTADGGPTAEDIVTKVLSRAEGGSIVLMHLGGFHTLEALPGIVDGLRQRGLEPVTLSEMFGV